MAAIGTIRKYTGFLIFVIGLSIVAFLLMDSSNSNTGIFGRNESFVGVINGHEVSYQEFNYKYEQNAESYRLNKETPTTSLSSEETIYVRNQTWEEILRDDIMGATFDEIGIDVSKKELFEMLHGSYPHPSIYNAFKNPQTNEFDPNQVLIYLKGLDNDEPGTEPGSKRKRWLAFEKFIKNDRFNTKYNSLIKKGLFTADWQGEMSYLETNQQTTFNYVYASFDEINDSEIEFNDQDLQTYLDKNSGLYKQEESRKIQYAIFDLTPTPDDSANTREKLAENYDAFNSAENDSLFLRINSHERFDNAYYKLDELFENPMADTFFSIPVDSIIGPFVHDGSYKYAKVLDRKLIPDSVKIKQIIFSFQNIKTPEEQAAKFALVDSIYNLIDSLGEDFDVMASLFSDDPILDLGWQKPAEKGTELNDFLFFKGQEGDIKKLVRDQFTLQLIKIEESTPTTEAVKVGNLSRSIVPSPDTERRIRERATSFSGNNRTKEAFITSIEENTEIRTGTAEDVRKDHYNVLGLGAARQIVRWAYEEGEGSVSKVFRIDDKFIIALLDMVKEEGTQSLEEVKTQIEVEVKKEKKGELLAKRMKENVGASLQSLASAMNKTVEEAASLTFNINNIEGVGLEPTVAAAGLGLEQGKISEPIVGEAGVFVIEVTSKNSPAEQQDYSFYASQLARQKASRINVGLFEALKDGADIEDNRSQYY